MHQDGFVSCLFLYCYVSMKKVIRHLPLHPPSSSHPEVGDLVGELPGHEAPQLRPVLAEEVALGAAREGADP